MQQITINVRDELVYRFGIEALKKKFERELELLYVREIGLKIKAAVDEAGLENDILWKEARKKTWGKHKARLLAKAEAGQRALDAEKQQQTQL